MLPSKFTMTIKRGDVFRHVLAGAGGWGDPLERDPAAVLRDVRNELLSADKALADYGVSSRNKEVDADATDRERRDELRACAAGARCPRSNGDDPLSAEAKSG